MCSISGIVSIPLKSVPNNLNVMMNTLTHRGIDGFGTYHDEHVSLGHTRLSIIDLAGGIQPMCNNNICITFNGEIFNYIELREELKKRGHTFKTNSDTEVIIVAYKEYDLNFVDHLNGQFAFAIWDSLKKRLVLVRDRVGICPLFYTRQNDLLYFASELKALISGQSPKISAVGLDEIFTFWSTVAPNTVFENIFQVCPGHMLVIENGTISDKTYWDWTFPEKFKSVEPEELYSKLKQATNIRLRADVKVGAYLSGGLDSSALVALIKKEKDVKTFSITFSDKDLDESSFQKDVADYLKVEHHSVRFDNNELANEFPSTIYHTETPILRTAPTPMKQLSKLVHDFGYKVILTGEGADEVFGGYDIFKENKIRQWMAKNPDSKWKAQLLKRLYPYLENSSTFFYLQNFYSVGLHDPTNPVFSHMPRWVNTAQCKVFFNKEYFADLKETAIDRLISSLPDDFQTWDSFNKAQYLECKTLLSNYLLCSQGDRMLMANTVEGRFPFLDHEVIEFASRLPLDLKMKVLNEKYLLKRAFADKLPQNVIKRFKQPYRAPNIPLFFSSKPPEYVSELLSEDAIKKFGYFDYKKVKLFLERIKKVNITNKDNMAFIGILSTQLLHYQFKELL